MEKGGLERGRGRVSVVESVYINYKRRRECAQELHAARSLSYLRDVVCVGSVAVGQSLLVDLSNDVGEADKVGHGEASIERAFYEVGFGADKVDVLFREVSIGRVDVRHDLREPLVVRHEPVRAEHAHELPPGKRRRGLDGLLHELVEKLCVGLVSSALLLRSVHLLRRRIRYRGVAAVVVVEGEGRNRKGGA